MKMKRITALLLAAAMLNSLSSIFTRAVIKSSRNNR